MVGATRWFISKPFDGRAIINGLIASGIAIGLMIGFIELSEKFIPYLKVLHDTKNMILIFAGIIILGIIHYSFQHTQVCCKIFKNET